MRHITQALPGARPRVRAGSHPVGIERGWWRPVPRHDARRIVLAARIYDRTGRARGARNGPLGHVALEVLDLLAALCDRRTGRLEPSYAYLMRQLRRSRDAVTRALAALRAHGFLDWLRRHQPCPQPNRGPQIKQASNAYRLEMPPRAARLVPVPPVPDIGAPEPVREASILDAALEAFRVARERDTGGHGQMGSKIA